MLRYPDVSSTHIVFVYANDLWMVPREGGVASPLASPPGQELMPKFSPDGKQIAFVGNYDGNRDLYVLPTDGGLARRVTYHPATEQLCDWTPDGRLIYMTNGFAGLARQQQLFTVSSEGGLPEQVSVPYGANGAISADGEWLAYTPHAIDFRTWKRYRGGMQTDIWLFNLKTHQSKLITDWEGIDSLPMWNGDTIYYLCDQAQNHRLNIWSYNTKTGDRKQVTDFSDYDVKWPSIGPGNKNSGEIVFQCGALLYLLDLKTGQSHPVNITIPGDRPKLRPMHKDGVNYIMSWDVSPTGKRIALSCRGDIWTIPTKEGSARRLTATADLADRDATWSPDGKSVAWLSDKTGEYEIYIASADGKGETRQVTSDGSCFRNLINWSPDSRHILFNDKTGSLYMCDVESGKNKLVDKDMWTNDIRPNWSRDSNWLVYGKSCENQNSALWLYNVEKGEKHQVTSGMYNDTTPTFDRDGDFIYFASNRDFNAPIYEDLGTTWIYANTDQLFCAPLRKDVKSPLIAKNDHEGDDEKKDEEAEDKKEDKKKEDEKKDKKDDEDKSDKKDEKDAKPVKIDIDGFESRVVKLPMKSGHYANLAVNDKGQLVFTHLPDRGTEGKPDIQVLDLKDEKKEAKTVASGVGAFLMTNDGKKLLIQKDGKNFYLVDAAPDQKLEKAAPTTGLEMDIDPRQEWIQIFNEAWRLHRDYFYVENMHGVDWKKIREQYNAMLVDCTSRDDVTYVIGEMISELNIGHAYVRGAGDVETEPSVSVGMLGCDYALENGAYRIKKIVQGAAWDTDARSPLRTPGVDVNEGDYLLAVNGQKVNESRDPWAAFQGLADCVVTLTVSTKPKMDDDAREVVVKTISNEGAQRYRAWIERNRAYVAKKTDNQVGYIYVPNTGTDGQNDLFRQFQGQKDKAALIIDERWNGGGQIPTRFIELLNRPVTNYWARRDGKDWVWPPDSHQGPLCMLINGLAGSGGDMFPWLFKHNKLGKVIGTRTWGGLVGISGNPAFIDGGNTNVPTFGFYETDGTWGVEGHGVDPDIMILDDPAQMQDGNDPQLDTAIELMINEVKNYPKPPKRPAAPDRSGMGVREEDH